LRLRRIANVCVPLFDVLLAIAAVPAALILLLVRRLGMQRLKVCRAILWRIGVLPVRRHYYEPLIDPRELRLPLSDERDLPGIDWNEAGQLAALSELVYASELGQFGRGGRPGLQFRFDNGAFESGDAEFLYQMIRRHKPARVFEVGSGHSTLIVQEAIRKNRSERGDYACEHVCIEPYENNWLAAADVRILRTPVEQVDPVLFDRLADGDLLFIDSSHVIRPQGDVVTEYLGIMPRLRPGVIVHVHDVFSPRDYPPEWVREKQLLWNEQYLLEAFLTENRSWSIVGALNYLKHRHFDRLLQVCPHLTPDREPGSFYLRKRQV
jgi:predicted O-methyltransferase YrrM